MYLSAGIVGLIVLILYGWFISIGPWHARGYTSNYYWQMASAFQHGQLELETKPDPALLALPNLYDPKARKDIPLLGDASVYNGKYYLYFGPLPSLLLLPVTALFRVQPGDQVFAYIFILGIFFVQSLLFIEIFQHYFAGCTNWIVPLGISFLGLTGPFTRMLTHPFIHEASISGGQFFSTAGLYAAFRALHDEPIDNRKLLLAGVLWAFSIATKITQLIPISCMVVLTIIFILYENKSTGLSWRFLRPTMLLIAPLLLTGILLAWYNWARFDSMFEFGLYYQLAAFNLQANYDALFSRVYVIQNIYNYFFNPFEWKGTFPFAAPLAGSEKPIFLSPELPKLYAVEGRFAGLIPSTPTLIFAVVPLFLLIAAFIRLSKENTTKSSGRWNWSVASLLASFVAGSIPTLLIFYVGFRYKTEFITGLTMLALIGLCQSYMFLNKEASKNAFTFIGAGSVLYSVFINVVLAFSGIYG